jgi:hypothetical protein
MLQTFWPAIASAFPAACCGVSERIIDRLKFLTGNPARGGTAACCRVIFNFYHLIFEFVSCFEFRASNLIFNSLGIVILKAVPISGLLFTFMLPPIASRTL